MAFTPKKTVIYSVGLLGGSIGLGLKESGYTGHVTGLSSPVNLPLAQSLGCIDEGLPYDRLAAALDGADLLLLCSPIGAIKKTLSDCASIALPPGLVITDVGSTKAEIVAHAKKVLPPHVHFIGGHPMAGAEKSGPQAADPYLFQNVTYVLTPSEGTVGEIDRDLAHFLERTLGCRTLFLDPGLHDRIVAAVSHVPHLLAVALVNTVQDVENAVPGTLGLAAGGFRDLTRIASAPYSIWHDILATNKEAIGPVLDRVIESLSAMKQLLRDDRLSSCFESARATCSRIPQNAKGFIRRLSEVLVMVKDQPGMIASIASSLYKKNININDIEVLKVREGEGGTIRLAFEGPAVAKAAVEALNEAGFSARERN
jgi:prephenate dehydrogenase